MKELIVADVIIAYLIWKGSYNRRLWRLFGMKL